MNNEIPNKLNPFQPQENKNNEIEYIFSLFMQKLEFAINKMEMIVDQKYYDGFLEGFTRGFNAGRESYDD